jgi:GNAT superfamily N-acetyltransferase
MVLWEVDAGTGAATVYGRVVSEAYRGGWANALLVAAAVETAAALGVKRCRFEVPEGNRDTEKLMLRAGAALVSETAIFVRLVSGADRPMRQS